MNFRKLLAIVLIVAILGGSLAACGSTTEASEPVDMVIATDIHYISQDLTDNGEYFMEVVLNGDGKVSHHAEAVAEAFFYENMVNQPDIMILSGDLSMNGAVESHKALVEKLKKVQASGIEVLVIPGNHDVDKPASFSFSENEYAIVESATSEQFIEMYYDFGPAQARSTDGVTFSYIYEAAPDLWILMLDSNCYGEGFVNDETLEWLEEELKIAKKKNINVISVTHQNIFAHSELLSFGYQLYNHKAIRALFNEYGVKLNLSGHIHIQNIMEEDGITEIATSSLSTTHIQYGVLHYEDGSVSYEVRETDVEGWASDNGITDETLNNFSWYAPDFFKEVGRLQIKEAFYGTEYSDEAIDLFAETFAEINSAYFSGKHIDLDETFASLNPDLKDSSIAEMTLEDGIELYRGNKDGFHLRYLESMIDKNENERREITIEL